MGFTDKNRQSYNSLEDYLDSQFVSLRQFLPERHGWLSWNFPPVNCAGGTIVTSGRINLFRIDVPRTVTINNILAIVTTAGSTLTSGQNLAGIYDSSGNRLGQTADQSTPWTSTGLKTMALTAPVTIQGSQDTYLYVAILSVGTTPPTFARTIASTPVSTAWNGGILVPASFYYADGPAGQTALPTSITLSSNASANVGYWTGLS